MGGMDALARGRRAVAWRLVHGLWQGAQRAGAITADTPAGRLFASFGPGSVIELDRLAGEPVDILVNERLIARGEVVVVDENFGVRVVEVVRRGGDSDERAS